MLFLAGFLIAGVSVGNSLNTTSSTSGPNGWYCDGDIYDGECKPNENVTCCLSRIEGGCADVECGSDPGED
jgi:hypothetical protein